MAVVPACEVTEDDPAEVAADAGLVYVTDQIPGIHRRRRGRGFSYQHADGRPVSRRTRARIQALAVPPAWEQVWIAEDPRAHLQATGRDSRGRKVYRYHDEWRRVRDANKYDRLARFGAALGTLRPEIESMMNGRTLTKDLVLGTVLHLLDETLIRVGNAEYANDNETYGLTTLTDEHVQAGTERVVFHFVGKGNVDHEIRVSDRKLARLVRRCHELGGQELFTYRDDSGDAVPITSTDVNDYLHDRVGSNTSAKDFRTWGGTVTVLDVLAQAGRARTAKGRQRRVLDAIDLAAERLGNTRTVARECYLHPAVVDAYEDDSLADAWAGARTSTWYSRAERATLAVLEAGTG